MVSFWPWKTDDNSPASFEKALSTLSDRITKSNAKLDSLRQRSRRYSALWTLYTSFAYLLCTVTQSDELQKQRETTIEKLKAATKYNTTQELLKKYGGTPPSKDKSIRGGLEDGKAKEKTSPDSIQRRTNFIPPPTANIPGRNGLVSLPGTPQRGTPRAQDHQGQSPPFTASAAVAPWREPLPEEDPSAVFAPNAFSSAPQYAQPGEGTRWYDRLMDVILGEDETLPKNRLALICQRCRLVNGQAPPGVQRLEDVGDWRCSGCGTMNGEEKEGAKLLKQIQKDTDTLASTKELADGNQAVKMLESPEESDSPSSDNERQSESSEDVESVKDEKENPSTRGKTGGAQEVTHQARRRSSRVSKKAKA
ncbi:MAG: hypothetical protein Q9222_005623 [Ikaeria aurantiellina]